MFPAFVENPKNIQFQGQDADESILLLLRAHPVTNLSWIIPAILVFFIPFFIPDFLLLLNLDITVLSSFYILALIVIDYLLVLVIVFEGFLNWYFNVYIITTKNLIDIDFHSLLYNNIDITPLRNVEDANSDQGGILRSIFNFGDVFVRTAGAVEINDLKAIPNPHKVADYIIDLAAKVKGP